MAANLPAHNDYTALFKPGALNGVRIGYQKALLTPVFALALEDLQRLGATVVDVRLFRIPEYTSLTELAGIPNEFKAGLNHYLATEAGPGLPVNTLGDIIAFNNQHPDQVKYGQDLLIASNATPGLAELGPIQALPTITSTAASLDLAFTTNDLDILVGPGDWYSYHAAASHWSSLVVPAGMNGKVPEGIQFVGRPFTEPQLLAYAAAFEPLGRARVPHPTQMSARLSSVACPATLGATALPAGASPLAKPTLPATGGRDDLAAVGALVVGGLVTRRCVRRSVTSRG
jgi:amidase